MQADAPSFRLSLACFGGVLLIIGIGLFAFAVSLHSLLFMALLWASCCALLQGHPYQEIRDFMSAAVTRALPAIQIFILIGMVIASFIKAGTIATLMYFGLDWLSPALFLPIGMLLCAIMSVATGTSWGTVGTLGVVFIGMGSAMGIPLPVVAGMVVCGATFGDKMSPVSDTTNLAAMSADTNLYRHIYVMLYTTLPSFVLALVIFTLLGTGYANNEFRADELLDIRQALTGEYRFSPLITLLPIAVLAVLSIRRFAPEVTMSLSVVVAVLVAIIYQHQDPVAVLNSLWANTPGTTGLESIDELLGRGGISSMSYTLILAVLAITLGGILHGAGFLTVLLAGIISRIKRTTSLLATTILSGMIGNMGLGEAYISIILNCQLFQQKFDEAGLERAMLSRSVEEGATLTTPLIPWTTAGAFYTATLGVPVLDYIGFAFFNYLNGIIAVIMAALGLGLFRSTGRN
ncbi:MAG: Na+/H+ antiporter NhaC [Gammaproteobacteria bacterium]